MDNSSNETIQEQHRQIIVTILMISFLALTIISIGRIAYLTLFIMPISYLQDKFKVIIGLPVGAAISLGIVTLLRQTEGKIVFKAFDVALEGASGPILLWVICYISIAFTIWLLWS